MEFTFCWREEHAATQDYITREFADSSEAEAIFLRLWNSRPCDCCAPVWWAGDRRLSDRPLFLPLED